MTFLASIRHSSETDKTEIFANVFKYINPLWVDATHVLVIIISDNCSISFEKQVYIIYYQKYITPRSSDRRPNISLGEIRFRIFSVILALSVSLSDERVSRLT